MIALADEIWGDCDGKTILENQYGKGKVVWGKALKQLMNEIKVMPDFSFNGNENLDFIHRRLADTDIYFIRNKSEQELAGEAQFRIVNRQPEIWNAVTGSITKIKNYTSTSSKTIVPITLQPEESAFIIFSSQFVEKNEKANKPTLSKNTNSLLVKGAWVVHFPKNKKGVGAVVFDSLYSWHQSDVFDIKFFSGIATYKKEIDIPKEIDLDASKVILDLGVVRDLAHVFINGKDVGISWVKPNRMEVTQFLVNGKNTLQIEVANTWHNRLCGDARLPQNERITSSNVTRLPNPWSYPMKVIPIQNEKDDYDLQDAGLLGPVKIEFISKSNR